MPNSDDTLLAYVLGDLDAAQRDQLDKQLKTDQSGQARVSWLRRMLDDIRIVGDVQRRGLFEVSEQQRIALKTIAAQTALEQQDEGAMSKAANAIRRTIDKVAALLVFDSAREQEAVLGFRGAVAERVLRFEFDGGSVDLRMSEMSAGDETVMVQGEVELLTGGMGEAVGVQLLTGAGGQAGVTPIARADVLDGYFELAAQRGKYQLVLTLSSAQIMLQPIVIEQM